MSVFRIYVEKKPEFAVEARSVLSDVQTALRLNVTDIRIFHRYDADHLTAEAFQRAVPTVFSEPAVDHTYTELPALEEGQRTFATEYLPGQFDQRADSCEQCIQILLQGERCRVRTADVYVVTGNLTDAEFDRLKKYLINPVERREASPELPETLDTNYTIPTTVETLTGFISLSEDELKQFIADYGLAMDLGDIQFCQKYFRDTEHRDPTITEVRMIDTYWSDHCRHTTFLTQISDVDIPTDYIRETYDAYCTVRQELGRGEKPMTLMDLATIAAKKLKADGKLNDLDESEEINACSVKIKVDIDGKEEDWILMFKNETHNHPTEIEPFGGAATCLGGAIRDPLSGRSYVYQAMRVTGAAQSAGAGQRIPLPASCPRERSPWVLPTATAPTATRSVWQPATWQRYTTPATWRSVWRSVRYWVLLRLPISAEKPPSPAILSFCWAARPDVTAAAVRPVLPSPTPWNLWDTAVQKSRRVTLRKNANSSVCSATPL